MFFWSGSFFAQAPQKWTSAELFEQVKKLNFFGSVLYVAAHPDDENTKLISYFSNYYHAQTAYLSLTRGDGGQNLIGTELREQLGALRTQELLAARKIDGGLQFFTRANDFGFSKTPSETFAIWDKNKVLEDVIYAFETFQPDIVIHRFDHRTEGTTHGHHTASAQLSLEAQKYLKYKPKRVFFNTSWWFYGTSEAFEKADKTNLLAVNANVYYPILGKSNNEIAALSRSQHRCQGFGTIGTRGDEVEYLELLAGTKPETENIFEGIDTTWNRIQGGKMIGELLIQVEQNFNFVTPYLHVPKFVEAYNLLQKLEDSHWKTIKLQQLKNIIEAALGLYLEAIATTEKTTHSDAFNLTIETINRSEVPVVLKKVSYGLSDLDIPTTLLLNNQKRTFQKNEIYVPKNIPHSNLFWLQSDFSEGMYQIPDKTKRIQPEENYNWVRFELEISGTTFEFSKPIQFKKNNPSKGETYLPFIVVPEITIKSEPQVLLFNTDEPKIVTITITSHTKSGTGQLELKADNWKIEPPFQPFEIKHQNETQTYTFKVYPPRNQQSNELEIQATFKGNIYNKELIQIDYDHIPKQTLLIPAVSKLVKLDLKTKPKKIGYIMGAGDEIPKHLKNIGYQVEEIESQSIELTKLVSFDVIICGIRAFNTEHELAKKNKTLFDFVNQGGTLIVQYNTKNGLVTENVAPYPLTISNDRITNEKAKVTFLAPLHPVLNVPNTITANDFEGWKQELGLYFPNSFDKAFTPIFAANDEGESEKKGLLLVAKYGKGNYIYTGLSFFRELPEGVAGAFRLFVNLINIE